MYRCLEFSVALFFLVLFAPLMLLTAIVILLFMGRPILFRQRRQGLYSKPFTIYKFRTMTNDPHNPKLTPLGRFLRNTSIDELPQLFNILKDDLGFVGPRPLLLEDLQFFSPEQARRHLVKPGITGWAQINGRNAISWQQKFNLDVWYVDNESFWLNLKIIFLTMFVVLSGKGIDFNDDYTESGKS